MGSKTEWYLECAKDAVKFVMSKMTIGSANKFGDVVKSRGKSIFCVIGHSIEFSRLGNKQMEERLRIISVVAQKDGCGNCGEQAIIAFVYLMDNKGDVRPIELFKFTNKDHNYVVIGRLRGSVIETPATWGPEAINLGTRSNYL